MSFKTPLNQVFGLGSAGEGTSHWWQQRLTAIALIPLGLWFAVALARIDPGSYEAAIDWIRNPITAVLLSLTVGCLVFHSWLGIRVVVEDYVGRPARLVVLLLSSFAHIFLIAICLFSILKIAVGTDA